MSLSANTKHGNLVTMHLNLKSLLAICVILTTTRATSEVAEDPSITPADVATLLERQIDVAPVHYTSCKILSGLAIPQPSDACSLASTTTEQASTSSSRTKTPTSTTTKPPTTTTKPTTPSITPPTNPAAAWTWTFVQTDPKSYTMALTTTFTPPPECTGSFTQIGTEYWQNAILPAPHTTLTSCYPSEFFSSVVGAANSVSLPPFDPLVCPAGWSSIPWNSTYFACCPE
jgi:hypothetical protein